MPESVRATRWTKSELPAAVGYRHFEIAILREEIDLVLGQIGCPISPPVSS
jgi:hypothetical protein